MSESVHQTMPRNLKFALVGVWFQAVVNLGLGFFFLALVNDAVEHGQEEGTAFVRFIAYISIVIGALLAACGIAAPRRQGWVRTTVLVIEAISLVSGVIGLFSGQLSSVLGIVLAIVIGKEFLSDSGRAWFHRS